MLITVPGGDDGPGGVLVCAENKIIYQNYDTDVEGIEALIPRRMGDDSQGILIVSVATHKQKDLFFFLVQVQCISIHDIFYLFLSLLMTINLAIFRMSFL